VKNQHCCGLIDMSDVLLAVGAETNRGFRIKQLTVIFCQLFLVQFQGAQDTVEVEDS